ncbi:VOC family protein [Streptomyces sp. NBC_00237]|uniref:VOC family protein n=1 Tax=Streptomyces sp. NBC_00237 TaxID=2975687 RepID=UPI00225885E3|nr:VOC family protein [Streptomyces sp. NBC_00237]MCX5207145.1 VOC family protein [Streptomyces sp. NBC_00237]
MAVAKRPVLVLDCAEADELAAFYARLFDAETRRGEDMDFVEVIGHDGVHLAIRRDHGYAPPSWPRPDDSQQAHLRILVADEDMDEAEREVIGLGARPLETPNNAGLSRDVRRFSDPAGHPFSLVSSPTGSGKEQPEGELRLA